MSEIKEKMTEVIRSLPDDATYEEIMSRPSSQFINDAGSRLKSGRELAFERMIERGMEDARNERVISNEEMERRIR